MLVETETLLSSLPSCFRKQPPEPITNDFLFVVFFHSLPTPTCSHVSMNDDGGDWQQKGGFGIIGFSLTKAIN